MTFIELIIAGTSGAGGIKLLELALNEIKQRSNRKKSATRFLDEHLDPLLKSADELVGKLYSLIREDFKDMKHLPLNLNDNNDYISLFYLLAKLWADIEIIKREGLSVAIAEDKRGKLYENFTNCLQSKHLRLVDRITQRAVGELLIKERNMQLETISFIEFDTLLENKNPTVDKWTKSISKILSSMKDKGARQDIIQYALVVHAMIDTLDKEHAVTKDRKPYTDKLSNKSRTNLKYTTFKHYLSFVENSDKYIYKNKHVKK